MESSLSAPSKMATITINDSPGLQEAVEAMHMKPGSLQTDPKATLLLPGIDSGYSSQRSTPDSSKLVDRSDDSSRWALPFRKPKQKLKRFEVPIPEQTKERFADLRELFANELNAFTRSLPGKDSILMSLAVFGETEATAVPWVHIQCHRAIVRKVRNFFNQPMVKAEFEPQVPALRSPLLQVLITPLAPRLLAKLHEQSITFRPDIPHDPISIFGDPFLQFPGTLCGMRIESDKPNTGSATMGGAIVATNEHGEKVWYGMTAGHFLSDTSNDPPQDDDSENCLSDDEEEYEIDLGLEYTNDDRGMGHMELETNRVPYNPSGHDGWPMIGNVSAFSHTMSENRDWALTKLEGPRFCLLNRTDIGKVVDQVSPSTEDLEVAIISSRGLIIASMSNSWSYMKLAPGNVLVRTRVLSIKKFSREVIKPGDSGAWVVECNNGGLIGHIVASDVFGRAYVVPIQDTFEDIKTRLSAESVEIGSLFHTENIRIDDTNELELLPDFIICEAQDIDVQAWAQRVAIGSVPDRILSKPSNFNDDALIDDFLNSYYTPLHTSSQAPAGSPEVTKEPSQPFSLDEFQDDTLGVENTQEGGNIWRWPPGQVEIPFDINTIDFSVPVAMQPPTPGADLNVTKATIPTTGGSSKRVAEDTLESDRRSIVCPVRGG